MSLADNRSAIDRAVDAGLLAGAVTAVWHRGEVVQINEIGHRDVEAGLPMRQDTIFRIASMTKPVTVAAAMSLVEQGRLALSDPITRWAPEFADTPVLVDPDGSLQHTTAARHPITIEQLMTHRSGLAYPFSVLGPISQAYAAVSLRQDADSWLAQIASLPLLHQPGEQLTYGHSTDVLGVVLSRIEGKPLQAVLAERILEPLGMADTGFWVDPQKQQRAATMYRLDEHGTLRNDVMGPIPVRDRWFSQGGAGLVSTVGDYLRFARMLLGGGQVDGTRVLTEQSVRLMRTDRLTAENMRRPFLGAPFWVGRGFGLNLSVVTDPTRSAPLFGPGGLGTFGWPGAYGTWWQADPQNQLIVVYLIQNYPDLTAMAGAVTGDPGRSAVQAVQPRFVRTTYAALGL